MTLRNIVQSHSYSFLFFVFVVFVVVSAIRFCLSVCQSALDTGYVSGSPSKVP